MGIPIMTIRRLWDRLILLMGIPVLTRRHLYTETAPIRFILLLSEPNYMSSLQLNVDACDNNVPQKCDTAIAHITVIRENFPPVFINVPYQVSISEFRPVGSSLFQVSLIADTFCETSWTSYQCQSDEENVEIVDISSNYDNGTK